MLETVVASNQQFTYFLRNGAFSPNSIEAVIQEGFRTSTTPLSITSFKSYAVGKNFQETCLLLQHIKPTGNTSPVNNI